MPVHLQREIDRLNQMILDLAGRVEANVQTAVRAVLGGDPALADSMVRADEAIDELEIDVEEECLKTLALYQPVATDLRYIIAILKINNDLERIGDLAENLARRVERLVSWQNLELPEVLPRMADKALELLRRVLDALVRENLEDSNRVLHEDRLVDEMNREMYHFAIARMAADPAHASQYVELLLCAKDLERIADHVSNIAEDIIYQVSGEIVRHGGPGGRED